MDPGGPMTAGLEAFLSQRGRRGRHGGRPRTVVLGRQRPRAMDVHRSMGRMARTRCVMLVKAEAGQLETDLGPEFRTLACPGRHRRARAPSTVDRRVRVVARPAVLRDRTGCRARADTRILRRPEMPRRAARWRSTSPRRRPACTPSRWRRSTAI